MTKIEILRVRTDRRTQLVDVTSEVQTVVSKSGVEHGVCYVYVPHTTAGVTINEHADLMLLLISKASWTGLYRKEGLTGTPKETPIRTPKRFSRVRTSR